MKKRICSIVLSMAILLGCFAGAFVTSAASAAVDTLITFDEEYYYDAPDTIVRRATLIEDEDAAHGTVVKFGQVASSNTSTSNTNNPNYAHTFRLAGNDGNSALELVAGKTYNISYNIRKVSASANFKVELIMVSSNDTLSNIKLSDYKHELLAKEAAETNGAWNTVNVTFTAQNSGEAIMVLYRDDTEWGRIDPADVRFDNISVEEVADLPVDSTITFNEDYYTSLTDTDNGVIRRASLVEDSTGNNVIKFSFLYAAKGEQNPNGYKYPEAFRLLNSQTGKAITVEKGKTYSFTYDIKKLSNTDPVDFTINLLTVENSDALDDVNYKNYAGQVIADEDSSVSENWVTGKTVEFTAAATGEAVIVLRQTANNWRRLCDIRLDNIKVKEVVEGPVDYTVSFEEDYYANDTSNTALYAGTLFEDGDNGKVAQITRLRDVARDWNSTDWAYQNPAAIRLAKNNSSALTVEEGKSYILEYDIKRAATQGHGFTTQIHFTSDSITNFEVGTVLHTFDGTNDTAYQHMSTTFTATASSNVAIALRNTADCDSKVDNVDIRFDNITVKEIISYGVTVKNTPDESGQATVQVEKGKTFADIKVTPFAGAVVDGYYYDSKFTKPATGEITSDVTVYAKWKTVTLDSDNYLLANDYDAAGDRYATVESEGRDSTKALRIYHRINGSYPYSAPILATDGSEFETIAGHTYKVSFYYKSSADITNYASSIALAKKTGAISNNLDTYCFTGTDGNATKHQPASFYEKQDGTEVYKKYYNISFEFTADSVYPVYITAYLGTDSYIYIDDFKIIDVTAQNKVTIGEDVIYSGYKGEIVDISDYDEAGEYNYISYISNNKDFVGGEPIFRDLPLTAVTSQLAVTAVSADAADKKLSFRVNYDGVEFEEAENGIIAKAVTIGDRKYNISEIGLLAIPTDSLVGGALTLDTEGALKLSNENFHFTKTADGRIVAYADVIAADLTSEYTVVGFIRTNVKSIYSNTRKSLDTSVAEVAALENVSTVANMKQGYNLAWNSEFNEGSNLSDKITFVTAYNENEDGYKYRFADDSAHNYIDTVDGNSCYVGKSEMISNNEAVATRIRTKHNNYGVGYMEARIKFSSNANASGSFWLNGAGVNTGLVYDEGLSPEIDIIEYNSLASGTTSTIHMWYRKDGTKAYQDNLNDGTWQGIDLTQWHTYGILRTASKITIYVDDVAKLEIDRDDNSLKHIGWSNGISNLTDEQIGVMFENPTYAIFDGGFRTQQGQAAGATTEYYMDYIRFYE